jgi:beta-glucosidase
VAHNRGRLAPGSSLPKLGVVTLAAVSLVLALAANPAASASTGAKEPAATGSSVSGRQSPAGPAGTGTCPWVDSQAPISTRVDEVLAQLTLTEKLSMLSGTSTGNPGYAGYVPGVPSLCVPALKLEDNGSGVGDGQANITAFPDGEAAASTWDTSLVEQYGAAVGAEQAGKGTNLVLGPMINIMRAPLWGRNYETFSEDPYLTSAMGVAEVSGLQSQGVIAEIKHIGAYSQEYNRPNVNSVVSRRALEEIYQKPFAAAIEQGQAGAIMAAADYTNGAYNNQDPLLLTQDAKTNWQFPGFITSDWDGAHSVGAVEAGLDITMPAAGNYGTPLLAEAGNGSIPMAYINDHVARILNEMFVHGLFRHPDTGSLSADVSTPADVQLAQQVAEQSTVLLKNAGGQLPLSAGKATSIAVIGAAGSAQPKTVGCGSGAVTPTNVVTPLAGIQALAGPGTQVGYADGSSISAAANLAASSSVAIVFVNDEECEQGGAAYDDRTSLDAGGNQDQLIEATATANPHTIVVLDTGSPVSMPWLSKVQAVLEAWYPGQADGSAIAAILFGDASPSGHLTETWPRDLAQTPTSSSASWGNATTDDFYEGIDVGYRWYEVHNFSPLFPFGYGLSYTTFAFSHEHVTAHGGSSNPSFTVSATVTNTGSVAGAEVAQLYVGDPSSTGEPPKQLEGFAKVALQPAQSTQISFTVTKRDLSYWSTAANGWAIAPGKYRFMIGDSVANTPLRAVLGLPAASGATKVTVTAPKIVPAAQPTTVRSTVAVAGNAIQQSVHVSLVTPAGWTAVPSTPDVFDHVMPGTTLVTTWSVIAPPDESARLEQLGARATLTAGGSNLTLTGFEQVQVPELVTGQFTPASLLVTAGTSSTVSLRLTNHTGSAAATTWQVTPPSGLTVVPATGSVVLSPGQTTRETLTVSAASAGLNAELDVALTTTEGTATDHGDAFLAVVTPYASLAQAFNNVGITSDSTPTAGNFDGAGNSFSAEALAAAGITPGETINHDGATFTWPNVADGTADNVQVAGQTVDLQGSGSALAFLLSGTHGTSTGTGTITYTDETTESFTLVADNWTVAPAGATGPFSGNGGDDILAVGAHWNPTNSPNGDYQVAVFGYTVPVNPAKTVASVTLPATLGGGDGSGLQTAHIFAMAVGS